MRGSKVNWGISSDLTWSIGATGGRGFECRRVRWGFPGINISRISYSDSGEECGLLLLTHILEGSINRVHFMLLLPLYSVAHVLHNGKGFNAAHKPESLVNGVNVCVHLT